MRSEVKIIKPVLSCGLPKTGQTQEYSTKDDGFYEAGWWVGLLNENNKTRFIELEPVSGEFVIKDLATGLMWVKDGASVGCDNGGKQSRGDACLFARDLTFAGFTDWRLPNIFELISLINYKLHTPAIDPIFTNTQSDDSYGYWSSTTRANQTSDGWVVHFTIGQVLIGVTSYSLYIRPCRNF